MGGEFKNLTVSGTDVQSLVILNGNKINYQKAIMNEKSITEHEFSKEEFYRELSLDLSTYQTMAGKRIVTCRHESSLPVLNLIERFVSNVIKSNDKGFIKKTRTLINGSEKVTFTRTKLSPKFELMKAFITTVCRYESIYVYSECVTLFQDCCNELQLSPDVFASANVYMPAVKKYEGDLYIELIDLMRQKAKEKEFKKKVSNRRTNSLRCHKSSQEYIDALFEKYSRLLVLRVDLSYLTMIDPITEMPVQGVSYTQVKKDMQRFKNNWRHNKIFEHLVGYIWKLEYGEKKGYHYHIMFFYRGSAVQKDWYFSDQIGKYWVDKITKGRGNFHNCNANKKDYLHLGIGMIDATAPCDERLRINVRNVAGYLSKNEQILSMKIKGNDRAFGTGGEPGENSNRGRPRKLTLVCS